MAKIKKGQHFSQATEIKKGQHLSPQTELRKGQRLSPDTEFKKGHQPIVGFKKGHVSCNKGKPLSEDTKHKLSIASKGKHSSPSTEFTSKRCEDPEYRKLVSERLYKLWRDPEFVLKQLKARGVKPNKIELYLENILNSHLPDYKYNGDGRLGIALAGLVPDFVNVNGRKEIIEVFGDYWHQLKSPKWHQTEIGRIMAYNSVGWNCLVIWEHELKELTEEQVINKIKFFFRARTHSRA